MSPDHQAAYRAECEREYQEGCAANRAASAEALSKSSGPVSSLGLATGSLPVSSAEVLAVAGVLDELQTNNARHRLCYQRAAEILRVFVAKQEADEITELMTRRCAETGITFEEGLRRLAGLPTERQPEENVQSEPRHER